MANYILITKLKNGFGEICNLFTANVVIGRRIISHKSTKRTQVENRLTAFEALRERTEAFGLRLRIKRENNMMRANFIIFFMLLVADTSR